MVKQNTRRAERPLTMDADRPENARVPVSRPTVPEPSAWPFDRSSYNLSALPLEEYPNQLFHPVAPTNRSGVCIKIKSLGPQWMMNCSEYRRNPKNYGRIRLYNTTGFLVDGRVVTRWVIPGYIRFKNHSYFDLDHPTRVIGRAFRCSHVGRVDGKRSLLVWDEADAEAVPSVYLVATTAREIGYVDLSAQGLTSNGRAILAASSYGLEQNIMWLLMAQSTLRGAKGVFLFDGSSESLIPWHNRRGVHQP